MNDIVLTNKDPVELFKSAAIWIEAATMENEVSIIAVRLMDFGIFITARIKRSFGCVETTIAFSRHSIFDCESPLTNARQFDNFVNGSLSEVSTVTNISGNTHVLVTDYFREFVGKHFDEWCKSANINTEREDYAIDIKMVESSITI